MPSQDDASKLNIEPEIKGYIEITTMAVKLRILTGTKEFSLTEEPASTINYVGFHISYVALYWNISKFLTVIR